MPTWLAGIQFCRMRSETSMSAWISALDWNDTIEELSTCGNPE
jgi:hypothetical protein